MLSKIIGIAILVVIIILVIVFKNRDSFGTHVDPIYGAVGGGKEDLLADEKVNEIFKDEISEPIIAPYKGEVIRMDAELFGKASCKGRSRSCP